MSTHQNTISKSVESTLVTKIFMSVLFAAITGLFAQIKIPLPFTPVPITGQSFAVLAAGLALGSRWGMTSQIIYIALGAIGLPWFSHLSGGLNVVTGPTAGYLFGFILAAAMAGRARDFSWFKNSITKRCLAMLAITFIGIFVPGIFHLTLWMTFVSENPVSFSMILTMGLTPFIAGALVKSVAAAMVGSKIRVL